MNSDIVKGVGLLGKALWDATEGRTGEAILGVISALNLFGVNTRLVTQQIAGEVLKAATTSAPTSSSDNLL